MLSHTPPALVAPLAGCNDLFSLTGGLRCALTPGYFLASLRLAGPVERAVAGTECRQKVAHGASRGSDDARTLSPGRATEWPRRAQQISFTAIPQKRRKSGWKP